MSESLFPEILTVETPPEIEVQDSSVCFYCKSAPIPEHITYCPQCGFPQHASKEEQIEFINELRDKVKEHTRLEEIIGWSQTILFFTGITAIVGVLIQALPFFSVSSHLNLPVKDFIYVLIAVAPNFILYFWSKKKPFPAILVALCFVGMGTIVQLFLLPFSFWALILPLLFMVAFAHALFSYNDAVKIEKKLIVAPRELERG